MKISLSIVFSGFAVIILSLQVHLSTQQEQPYTLIVERPSDDILSLRCRDPSTHVDLNLEQNPNIKFYVNLTEGDRNGPSDLEERLTANGILKQGSKFTFRITRELNGLYSCGTSCAQQSNTVALICK